MRNGKAMRLSLRKVNDIETDGVPTWHAFRFRITESEEWRSENCATPLKLYGMKGERTLKFSCAMR